MDTNTVQSSGAVEPQLTLLLGLSEINMIITSLAELPYKYSAEVIGKVRTQADRALAEQRVFEKMVEAERNAVTRPTPVPVNHEHEAAKQYEKVKGLAEAEGPIPGTGLIPAEARHGR